MAEQAAGAAACQLTRVGLAEALREHARGTYCTEAAVDRASPLARARRLRLMLRRGPR